jgi:hypothetical protein
MAETDNPIYKSLRSLRPWAQIIGVVIAFAFVAFLLVEQGQDIEIGPSGFKATRPETPLEKNCRLESQQLSALDQEISEEIIALEEQVAAKDHELSETRAKCLAAQGKADHTPPDLFTVPSRPGQSRCRTEITVSNEMGSTYALPRGDFETALTSAAQERDTIQSKIAAKLDFAHFPLNGWSP